MGITVSPFRARSALAWLFFATAYTIPAKKPNSTAVTEPKLTGSPKKTIPDAATGSLFSAPTILPENVVLVVTRMHQAVEYEIQTAAAPENAMAVSKTVGPRPILDEEGKDCEQWNRQEIIVEHGVPPTESVRILDTFLASETTAESADPKVVAKIPAKSPQDATPDEMTMRMNEISISPVTRPLNQITSP
ncbi:4217_t:CDS:2 [Acaulospora colombiana]|uniref:4217_t:CDS:1 n=1 Tax=Acaulospora colombiana TaxID=27376 RepID=A0ACA9LLM4_9GLOM|nr:4217_t:CDS:2 [Acaulospora colombiana]